VTEVEAKALVRQRDNYKCRDCGMTNDDHLAKNGRALDVHRIIPGYYYDPALCVTLCRSCHAKKPKTIDSAFWADEEKAGILFFFLNLYSPSHRRVYDALQVEAEHQGIEVGELLGTILLEYCEQHAPLNYVI
jgi:hypothetical protein